VLAFQLGVLLLLGASAVGTGVFPAALVGWTLVAVTIALTALAACWPLPRTS
jgi:hypothetical protein